MVFLKGIKNVLFDLGGVLVDINPSLTIQKFDKLGISDARKLVDPYENRGVFKDFEKGLISERSFYDGLKRLSAINISDQEIKDAWAATIIGYPTFKIELLKKIKTLFRTFLLSNTNELHLEICRYSVPGGGVLEDLFEKVFYSFEMGLTKPGRESFQYVVKSTSIQPIDTLFIDDSKANIDAAEKLGFKVFHVTDERDWTKLFEGITIQRRGNP